MKSLSELATIEQYVHTFSSSLAAKVQSQAEPIHDPGKHPRHERIDDMLIKPFPKQADLISACVKALEENNLAILACQMGTGKTPQGIGVVHCHANKKPYNALVVCPPHLTVKWEAELRKFLGGGFQVTIIQSWEEFINIRYSCVPTGPTWYIMSSTTAKLGYSKRCAAITRIKKVMTDIGMQKMSCLCCPRCDYPARNNDKDKSYATVDDIERMWAKCIGMYCRSCHASYHHDMTSCPNCDGVELRRCNEPLWQGCQHKVAPSQYAKVKRVRWFDYFIRDESHESKSAHSIDGHACATFSALAKNTLLLTGTLLAGKSEDLRPILFRLKPRDFINMGYTWTSEIEFAKGYGRIQTVVRTSEGGTARRSGKGSSKSTQQSVKPGIMPQLFPDFVANYTVFMSLTELATNLPSYFEETVPVAMEPPMAENYLEMQQTLINRFRELYTSNRKLAAKLLGPMLEALMTWPDVPYGRKPITIEDDLGHVHNIFIPVSLDRTAIYPKERELIRILQEEKARGRKCWVYSVRDETRDRLQQILESYGFKVAHLKASGKPSTRIEWLGKHGPSCDVGMCHPKLVETGIELFGPGYNFSTLIWYSTGFMLNTLRQASRRAWRIGQTQPCRTVYLYYDNSAQKNAVSIMASKLVAAEAIEGKFSDGGLADECQDEDVAMAVARSLADNIKVEVQQMYRPVEAGCSEKEKLDMLRARIARRRARLVQQGVL